MLQDSKEIKQADVCLVMPPVSFGCMPSLALGILKACLVKESISCYVDYANMFFSHAMGVRAFAAIYHGSLHGFLGEYIFNEAAGIENPYSIDDFIRYQLGDRENITDHLYLENALRHAIRIATEETEKTVDRVLAKNPKIVGCTAVFEQRNASLAILREIKKRCPDIITFMGGFTCFDYAGMAMLREFPFLDYVFCGESDDIFASSCRGMMEGTLHDLPYGLLRQGGPFPDDPPHRIVEDMESVPAPDYDDYMQMFHSWYGFDQYQVTRKRAEMRLILETSRGCWWGEKHACLFCGLNGQTKCYRKKSAEKSLAEIRETTKKYRNGHVCFADNILPNEWFQELLPALKETDTAFHFTAEIKANLREEQVKVLKDSGYDILQPGMESLSDHVLMLLHKGVTGIQNVALLKYARKYNMIVLWNILTGTIGETPEDYRIQTDVIPLLEHLEPPKNYSDIIYMRNSVYFNEQEKYGLKLVPDPVFRFISPNNEEYVEQIAFHFIDENRKEDPVLVLEKVRLRSAAKEWNQKWKNGDLITRLDMYDENDTLFLTDNRSISSQRNSQLTGIFRDIYLAADHPVGWKTLLRTVIKDREDYSEEDVSKAARELCERKLLLYLSGKYLSLAVGITKEKAMELSYREFFRKMLTDQKIRNLLAENKEGKDAAEKIAYVGRECGYLFDADTVRRTDLIPEKNEMDLLD